MSSQITRGPSIHRPSVILCFSSTPNSLYLFPLYSINSLLFRRLPFRLSIARFVIFQFNLRFVFAGRQSLQTDQPRLRRARVMQSLFRADRIVLAVSFSPVSTRKIFLAIRPLQYQYTNSYSGVFVSLSFVVVRFRTVSKSHSIINVICATLYESTAWRGRSAAMVFTDVSRLSTPK